MHLEIKEKFVGTWALRDVYQITAEGNRRFPFGQDLYGRIIYTAGGNVMAQIQLKSQPIFEKPVNITVPGDMEAGYVQVGYFAYYGSYDFHPTKPIVNHY